MKTRIYLWQFLCLLLPATLFGQYIDLRVSVKVILEPTNGLRPANVTDLVMHTAETNANLWMSSYYRGYRYRITEIVNIGGPSEGGINGPSYWYALANYGGIDLRDNPYWGQFQQATKTNTLYRLRANAVNVYVYRPKAGAAGGGGAFPIPPGAVQDTAGMAFVNEGAWWIVHELGHYFGQRHTHGGCGCPSTSGCSLYNGYYVGDDGLADTLREQAGDFCYTTKDQLARANFSKVFTNCTPGEQQLVDDTFFNVMSYHLPDTKDQVENVMTEMQVDLLADIANTDRAPMASGKSRFTSLSGSDASGDGSSDAPYRTLGKAVTVSSAGGGDVVLLRPGSYNEKFTINKAVTLRAPRTGWATIGKP